MVPDLSHRSTFCARLVLCAACALLSACAAFGSSESTSSSEPQRRSRAVSEEPESTAGQPEATAQSDAEGEPQGTEADPARLAETEAPNPAAGRFSVHEWGLVVAGARRGLSIATGPADPAAARRAPPPRDPETPPQPEFDSGRIAPAKPVFYVHLDDGLDEARFRLGVRSASRGRVVEHYPAAVRYERGTALVWEEVLARRGSCRGTYPGLGDPLCETRDGVCELAELSAYETTESACLRVGNAAVGLLFYRMAGARDTLPLDVRSRPDGSVLLRSIAAPPAGLVLRVHRRAAFANTRVRRVQLDADGRATVPGARSATGLLSADRGLAMLSAALDEAGLTAQERDAFLRAWRSALFGASARDAATAAAPAPDAHPLAPVGDALLYFWPRAEVDAALPLTITPQPREVRRVFVVRVDLSASEAP